MTILRPMTAALSLANSDVPCEFHASSRAASAAAPLVKFGPQIASRLGGAGPYAINQHTGLTLERLIAPWRQHRQAVLELTMPPGIPHRPPLAMRFWLSRRFGQDGGTGSTAAAAGRSSGRTMSYESLENMVRSRVRMFLRHTWL